MNHLLFITTLNHFDMPNRVPIDIYMITKLLLNSGNEILFGFSTQGVP